MKCKEMIEQLQKFDPDSEIIISDGYNYKFYKGEWEINAFENDVDIGVGGTEIVY